MAFWKKQAKDIANKAGTLAGDYLSRNAHDATKTAVDGMSLFKAKAAQIHNADYQQAKGNLFEYIEAAKFNRNAAFSGHVARAVPTDAIGQPHAAADILIRDGGKTVKEIQAKFTDKAANAVFDQAGGQKGHWGKYNGMDRLIRKDPNYSKNGSMLDEARSLAEKRNVPGGLHSKEFEDVYHHLTDETHYDGISSGGTTTEEIKSAYKNPRGFADSFERKQVIADMQYTAGRMAASTAVTAGIISGITNMFEVLKDEKTLSEALEDVGGEMVEGAVRGGATGVVSTAIRYHGLKTGSAILSDSSAATILAGGLVDSGVSLYAYAKGEIDSEELVRELQDTAVKSVSTVYFTKAVSAVVGAANPFVPMAVYTVASYVVTTGRELIQEAALNEAEYDRLRAIVEESTRTTKEYRRQLEMNMSLYSSKQRAIMTKFLVSFEYNIETGENYDQALFSILNFADQTGIALQHRTLEEFSKAMNSDEDFVLKKR